MKIKNKMFIIIGIPLFSILLIFVIGLISFSRINNIVDLVTSLQNDRSTMIDADRDAYQAYVETIRVQDAPNLEDYNNHLLSFNENADQTWSRIVDPGTRFTTEMMENFNNFKIDYSLWKENSIAIFDFTKVTIVENNKRDEAIKKSISQFDTMRNYIDQIGELFNTELSKDLDNDRRLEIEKGLSLVLNGDRDSYQAYVAQLLIIDAKNIEIINSIDASSSENISQTKDRVNQAALILGSNTVLQLLSLFNTAFENWRINSRLVIDISKTNFENFQKVIDLSNKVDSSFADMRDNINLLGEIQVKRVDVQTEIMTKIISSVKLLYTIIFIVSVILSAVIAFLIANKIILSLRKSIKATSEISKGDLTVDVDVVQDDEIGDLADSLRGMINNLNSVVNDVVKGSHQIASASTQLAEGNQDLSSRTEAQAAALEEISAAIEEMNSSIRANADNTITANKLSLDVSEKAEEGSDSVNHMIISMNEISDSSKKIGDIIEVINKIAFQTNLLALNASIEAARAGEHGKGFAVVAVEVRKLAKRSDKAAAEIAGIIKNSNEKVDEGVSIANTAGEMLTEINNAVKKVTVLVGEISAASQEQLSSVDEIDKTISSLDINTQKNAALAEEAAAATEELSAQAVELSSSMKFFKLKGMKSNRHSVKFISNKETKPKDNKQINMESYSVLDSEEHDEFNDLINEEDFKEF